ncbi:MAG: hypothetical protein PVH35_05095 [Syntrophobacterales bacterium]|jgi:hypothetical protein
MIDRNELKKCCKDIVHTYIDANFDSGSKVFRSVVNNCLQTVGITEELRKPQETEVLQKSIYAELQEEFRYWVKDKGSSRELINWLEGFIIGVNAVLPVLGETASSE